MYSITNPEKTDWIDGWDSQSQQKGKYKPFTNYIHKVNNVRGPNNSVRPTTHIINTGLQLQFTYLLS
jgi:hypothetical protein